MGAAVTIIVAANGVEDSVATSGVPVGGISGVVDGTAVSGIDEDRTIAPRVAVGDVTLGDGEVARRSLVSTIRVIVG